MFKLDLEQEVSATAFRPEPDIILHQVKFEIDFYTKKSNPKSEFNSDDMVQEIQPIYDQLILQTGHKFPFKFKGTFFLLTVKERIFKKHTHKIFRFSVFFLEFLIFAIFFFKIRQRKSNV